MARLLYGCTAADYTITSGGRVIPNTELTVWDAIEGGTQITDLTDYDGNAVGTVTSEGTGFVRFYGPDGETDNLWLDSGQNSRVLVRPTVITADIGDGSILDEDIAADADIDPTKIAGTALTRDLVVVDEANGNAMIAGGIGNTVNKVTVRATNPTSAHVEGHDTEAQGWYGHAEGAGSLAEGKISHAEGNDTICTANDSHSEGNLTATGRRWYADVSSEQVISPLTASSEDAGDGLGVLQYVLLPATFGDQTSYFPNPLTDDVTGRYGAGAQLDTKGNVYHSSHTPAVWTGDVPTTPNDLQWAMHPFCIMRGPEETDWAFAQIAKATYGGGQTKVYYIGAKPFATITCILGSYSPVLLDGGQGQHAEGWMSSASGYGAHAEGSMTRAWGFATHAEGRASAATGGYSHAEGRSTTASGDGSHAEGRDNTASGAHSHAEGNDTTASDSNAHAEGASTTASGANSHAEGYTTTASGDGAHAAGLGTVASGDYSHASGLETEATAYGSQATGIQSKATRNYQQAYSLGKRSAVGDNQLSRWAHHRGDCIGADWYDLRVMTGLENNRTYLFETTVIGRQTAGTAGAVGDSFAYKFQGAVTVASGVMTVLGTITRTLIGRTAGMAGDGLSTGPRMSAHTDIYQGGLIVRYDGIADTTFFVSAHSTVQELA